MKKINYNVTGAQRKKLVEVISKISGYDSKYLRLPTLGYQVGPYFVSKEGIVEVDENEKTLPEVMAEAVVNGFIGVTINTDQPEKAAEEAEKSAWSIPADGMSPEMIENLKKIVKAKSDLLKKAFSTDDLSIKEQRGNLVFEWFTDMDDSNKYAYLMFLNALIKLAKEAKRVTMAKKEVENDKYAWRCFLLRLGFIGPEYKEIRKLLMRNFQGSSAFKNSKKAEKNI